MLLDQRSGATLWLRRVGGPLATRGSTSLGAAHALALRRAAAELVDGWRPGGSAPTAPAP